MSFINVQGNEETFQRDVSEEEESNEDVESCDKQQSCNSENTIVDNQNINGESNESDETDPETEKGFYYRKPLHELASENRTKKKRKKRNIM